MRMFRRCSIIFLQLFFGIAWIIADSKQPCFTLRMLNLRTTQTPHYLFEMELQKNLTLYSVTRVLKEIPVPIWHIKIVQHSTVSEKSDPLFQQGPKVLYDGTYKICEFWKYVKRIRVFNNVAQMALSKDTTNMSLSCPLPVGTYVMRNIHVPPDTGFLKFMYWPNRIYTLFGTVYSQRNDKSLVEKCSYEINGTVLKTC